MNVFLRPYIFWFAAPVIMVLGVVAGIGSASAEQAQPSRPAPTVIPRTGNEAAARPLPSVVTGQVVLVDIQARTILVERRDGRLVDVLLNGNTVIKLGKIRVRPRDINLGDKVVVVGRPRAKQGVEAAVITVAPRPAAK
jgi:hypothetical protein